VRARGLLPLLLFLSAAAGTVLLGSRILSAERASAERTARERLRARATAAAASLEAEASRLLREAALGEPDAIREGGRFVKPGEPRPLPRLEVPRARDPEGAFYLDQGERAEAVDLEPERAAGLYGAAAAEERDPATRAVALFRSAALERRRGREAEARALEERFLAVVPAEARGTLEALVVRIRSGERGAGIRGEVLAALDTGEDALVRGLLREAGGGDADLGARAGEIALLHLLRGIAASSPTGAAAAEDGTLVAWVSEGGRTRFRAGPPPAPEEGLRFLRASDPPPDPAALVETATTGDPLPGLRVAAEAPRPAVEAEARRGARMLGGALLALLGAGTGALILGVRAARREAEAARARADFVTRVGHDLRTPLAKIRMYAETVAAGRTRGPEEAREFATVAVREAEALTGMVERVLDFSRTSAAPEPQARTPLDLAALAAEVADWHRPLLEREGIRLSMRALGPLPVRGEEGALRGAVSNLIENAVRHGRAGESVDVEARRAGTMAEVVVSDRGPGVPAGMEARIFERFVRGPGSAGSGAGLGLALVRDAAESHGGRASASNREGGGAEFVLAIPLREEGA